MRFNEMCQPSAEKFYGRLPHVGAAVSALSASYPETLCQRMPAAAKQAFSDSMCIIPLSAKLASCSCVDEHVAVPASVLNTPLSDPRPFFEDPPWVEELADCLDSRELLRYKFARRGHISVLEVVSTKLG